MERTTFEVNVFSGALCLMLAGYEPISARPDTSGTQRPDTILYTFPIAAYPTWEAYFRAKDRLNRLTQRTRRCQGPTA
jgi:hypothetical protein